MAGANLQGLPLAGLAGQDDLPDLYMQHASAFVLLNLTLLGAADRRLGSIFGFELPTSLGDLQGQATSFVGTAGGQLGAAAAGLAGLPSVVSIFTESQGLLKQGADVVKDAWKSFLHLSEQLAAIFTTFKPLQPVFASPGGMLQLLSSKTNVQLLVTTVQDLLATSDVLQAISNACKQISQIFGKVSATFSSAMNHLTGGGRRLLLVDDGRQLSAFSYEQLLKGIDFDGLIANMQSFFTNASGYATQLAEVNKVLGPALTSVTSMVQSGRRLGIADQKQFQQAIEQVVPLWQGVEGLGISMCPQVLSATGLSTSLVCRANSFVSGAGALSALSNLLTSCPAETASNSPEMSKCPTESMSAGVTDLLTKNSAALGWILYVIAGLTALGVLGGGAAAASKVMGGGDTDDEDSDEEKGESDDQRFRE